MEPSAGKIEIRKSRRVATVVLIVGGLGLTAALASDLFRIPLLVAVSGVAVLLGGVSLADRRPMLVLSPDGLRYSRWGRSEVPWYELAGFRWVTWRGQPFLQLMPRRPAELVAGFSPVGKLNHYSGRWVRMPDFSIQVTPLEVVSDTLERLVARYLPRDPASPVHFAS